MEVLQGFSEYADRLIFKPAVSFNSGGGGASCVLIDAALRCYLLGFLFCKPDIQVL